MPAGSIVYLDTCRVDLETGDVLRDNSAEPQRLTSRELALLRYLSERPGQEVHTTDLLRDVWGYAPTAQTRAPFHTMRRLRGKLEADPSSPRHLLTVFGVGYRFMAAAPRVEEAEVPTGHPALQAELRGPLSDAPLVSITGPAGAGKSHELRCLLAADSSAVLLSFPEISDLLAQIGGLPGAVHTLGLDDADALGAELAAAALAAAQARGLRLRLSRRAPAGLPGEITRTISGLPVPEAAALLITQRQRFRTGDDEDDARVIAAELHGNPRAITLIAAQGHTLPLSVLKARLEDGTWRSPKLAAQAAAQWATLPGDAQEALAACAAFWGPLSLAQASAVGDVSPYMLAGLVRRGVLMALPGERFAVPWSLREHARSQTPQPDARWLAWLHTLCSVDSLARRNERQGAGLHALRAAQRDIAAAARMHGDVAARRAAAALHDADGENEQAVAILRAGLSLDARQRAALLSVELGEPILAALGLPPEEVDALVAEVDGATAAALLRLHAALAVSRDGQPAEAAARLGEALALPGLPLSSRGTILRQQARCIGLLKDDQDAEALFAKAIRTFRRCGDRVGGMAARNSRGVLRLKHSQFQLARQDFTSVISEQAEIPQLFRDNARLNLAIIEQSEGNLREAIALFQAARGTLDPIREARVLLNLSATACALRDHPQAIQAARQALVTFEAYGETFSAVLALVNIAIPAFAAGELGTGREVAAEALRQSRTLAVPSLQGLACGIYATGLIGQDHEQCLAAFGEACVLLEEEPIKLLRVLQIFTLRAQEDGDEQVCAALSRACQRLRESTPHEHILEELNSILDSIGHCSTAPMS